MPYMKFHLADGSEVLLETSVAPVAPGPRPAGRVNNLVEEAQRSFEEAFSVIKRTVATAVEQLREAFPEAPDELEVEFGIKASLEANGLILAKAAGESSFTVKALWKKPS